MPTDRQPGQLLPGDSVKTSGKRGEVGTLVRIDGADGMMAFPGLDILYPYPLAKLSRWWDIERVWHANPGILVTIKARHPQHGYLVRGTIRCVGHEGTMLRWQPVDPDAVHLPVVVGDYRDAERALLEATSGLDEPDRFSEPPNRTNGCPTAD